MSDIPMAEARDNLAEVVNRVAFAKERVILSRRGKEIAAIVPLVDMRLLEKIEDLLDLEEARAALEEARSEGTIPWEKIKAELASSSAAEGGRVRASRRTVPINRNILQ